MKLKKSLLSSITTLVMVISAMPLVNVSASGATVSYKSFHKTYYSNIGRKVCEITLKRPVLNGKKKSYKKINKYLKKIQSEYVSYFLNLSNDIDPEAPYCYSVWSNIKLTYDKGKIISFKETYRDYTGGAHGGNDINGYTFNLKTGKKLNISKVSKYKGNIKSKIVSKFKRKIESGKDYYFENALQVIKNQRIKDYDYYLKGRYVYVVFSPLYSIAPYVSGVQKVRIKIS